MFLIFLVCGKISVGMKLNGACCNTGNCFFRTYKHTLNVDLGLPLISGDVYDSDCSFRFLVIQDISIFFILPRLLFSQI